MDAKFFNSLFAGFCSNSIKLCQSLLFGNFWSRPAGCFIIYGGAPTLDYTKILAVGNLSDSQFAIGNQTFAPSSTYKFIRRQASDCGLESPDSDIFTLTTDENGTIALRPNIPQDMLLERLAGGKFKLRWRYIRTNQLIEPKGFHIYIDSGGGFNFSNPLVTVGYYGAIEHSWNSSAYTNGHTYKFCIRSFADGAGETQNTDYVQGIADSQGPPAADGVQISVEEE